MPGFIWSKYPGKINFYKFSFSAYLYRGLWTALNIHLDKSDNLCPGDDSVLHTN